MTAQIPSDIVSSETGLRKNREEKTLAAERKKETLVGKNKGKIAKLPAEITIWTRTDLL